MFTVDFRINGGGEAMVNAINLSAMAGIGVTVGATPTLILAHSYRRADAVIQNTGSVAVKVSASPTLTFAGAGYLLAAGAELPWPYSSAAYGICDTAQSAAVRGLDATL
jgi:hypothetical protein